MRLKSFTASTMKEAMEMVRWELGEDAVIVSTRQGRGYGGGVRITAAVEEPDWDEGLTGGRGGAEPDSATPSPGPAALRRALEDHGTPPPIVERLVTAARVAGIEDPTLALAAALDDGFRFAPLPKRPDRPLMVVGPPGAGKTITVAKLAARAALARESVRVITTDTVRAGGVEQLAAFTRLMNVDLCAADGVQELGQAVGERNVGDLVLIDSAGTNPFAEADMEALAALIRAAGAEPVLVLAAGGDVLDSAEIAQAFAAIGATRILVTRLDMARRLGGLLAAADAGRLRFCDVSIDASVGKGLSPINPVSLARLLLPEAAPSAAERSLKEAVS
jgi:flagellar biosynthesis protein FlhF